jgi:antitoxin component of MazEF toxin-antitoxin module
MGAIEVEVKLRRKNQVTLPDAIVRQLDVQPGDRLVVELDEAHPGQMTIRPIRRSYAGLLTGVYGTDEEALEYVRAERASWEQ